ncbi:MAG: hypothetical protein CMG02_00100, partial [Candidatus Marinimicrobia bacterium]|nr:hypothetical protein [Candidatus Neomarinimicrobiota bacterium]
MKSCLICKSKTKKFKTKLPGFNHFNFKTESEGLTLIKCLKCNIIFNSKTRGTLNFNSSLYKEKNNDHIFYHDRKKVYRSQIIAEIIYRQTKIKKNLNILEIGSGKGYLLHHLNKKFQKSFFVGFDKFNYSKSKYFQKNISFLKNFSSLLCKNHFDIILISHTFNYFTKPLKLIKKLKFLIKKTGKIFVILPDIQKNPYYTLMADQKLILTKQSLSNLFEIYKLKAKILSHKLVKRELILSFSFSKLENSKKFNVDYTLEKNLKYLNKMKSKVLSLKTHKVAVFGTNVNSAFLDHYLGKKNKYFVSDSKLKKTKFRGKELINSK